MLVLATGRVQLDTCTATCVLRARVCDEVPGFRLSPGDEGTGQAGQDQGAEPKLLACGQHAYSR
jgi:hypothetical protein